MSQSNQILKSLPGFNGGRSVGLKLLLVCFLVLLMAIPILFIANISFERSGRAKGVRAEISQRYGGPQTVLGPVLSVPYGIKDGNGKISAYGEFVVFAEQGRVDVQNLETKIRKRSLFKVPTWQANVVFDADFKIPDKNLMA
ncbi:MAG TPA: cell envelope integrity protein CreD, partial [Hellea balneolensis]|nr:cell envelope integrity protein CreD [Hellea balneolensis]